MYGIGNFNNITATPPHKETKWDIMLMPAKLNTSHTETKI